ncbi:MgtC/SapB family protein [Cognatilysobacter tabacisoli]|uniref:MgtC/SapB family protein n=1 Tax=Cognatilysobacter tabacisoli TaxID=2315424 RepID=UPI000E6B42E3|nr:DUF4010 domain-containing protein [Lysobacter tabacisoli]
MLTETALSPHVLTGLAAALGIGLLVGIERERAKGAGPSRAAAGVRTFLLLSLGGAIAELVGPVGVAIAGVFVVAAVLASYRHTRRHDPGLTTEVAMLATFLLGVLAMRSAGLAAALGVVVAITLASKSRLHHFSREHLTPQELHDALLLVAAAFVVLPLLPDRPIDPWGAINPRRLWTLLVAVMGVSTAGYLALRLFGARWGLAIAGLAGGFVSSTATIAAMGDKARAEPPLAAAFASAGLVSNVGTVVQLAVVLAALSPPLLRHAAVPLAAAGTVAVAAAVLASVQAFRGGLDGHRLAGRRPFEPRHALAFVAIVAGAMLLAAVAQQLLGDRSLPWVLAATGLADVHAATASAAQLVAAGRVEQELALLAITAALATNSLMKCVMAALRGGRAYAWRVLPGIVAMVLAFALVVHFD